MFYYDKDCYGVEHCRYVKDKDYIEDVMNVLSILDDDDFCPVTIIDGSLGCYDGYDSIDELISDNVEPGEEFDEELFAYISAITAGEEAYGYPFALIEHIDESLSLYEVCPVENIQWDNLLIEYSNSHAYQIRPQYFHDNELTVDEALDKCMYALAREIENLR